MILEKRAMPQGVEEPHKPAAATRRRLPRKPEPGQDRGPDRPERMDRPDRPMPERPPAPAAVAPPPMHRPIPASGGLRLDDLYRLPMPKLFQVAEREGIAE